MADGLVHECSLARQRCDKAYCFTRQLSYKRKSWVRLRRVSYLGRYKQTDREDRQTDRQTDGQTDRQTLVVTDGLAVTASLPFFRLKMRNQIVITRDLWS